MRPRPLALAGSALLALAPAGALGAWSPPSALTPRDGAAYAVPQGAAAGGRALVAWVRAPAGTRGRARVQVAERAGPRARWGAPLALSPPGADAPRPALNARGDAVVAWVAGRRLVAAVRRGARGAWAVSIVADAGGAVRDLRVAVDRRGRPTAMWSEDAGEGFLVRVAARTSARAGWTVRAPRIRTSGDVPPVLALGRSGALVAWADGAGMRVARTVAGAFERPVTLSRDTGAPAAAVSGRGLALGAWSAALPGGTSVVLASGRERGADGWRASGDLGIGQEPVAAVGEGGDALVAWGLGAPGAPQGVEAATRRGARGPWRASTVVPARACRCTLRVVDAAVDGRGAALVTWRRDDAEAVSGGGAAALPPGSPRWRAAPLGAGRATGAPAVAADAAGGGLVAWAEPGPRGGVRAVARP